MAQNLQGDAPPGFLVLGFINGAHAACPEQPVNRVMAKEFARLGQSARTAGRWTQNNGAARACGRVRKPGF
jgi:hypothetical protein